ncbi:MAG: nucleotide sugar dehydrogenase [bacterium]|nr:nucleotide sugar dehydrogenase [bacterium]
MDINRLSVVGLGKLGLCAATCFASRGFNVIGVDINNAVVNAVNSGEPPFYEPGLQELMTANASRLCATIGYDEAITASDITFLIPPTPSRGDGHFSDEYLQQALRGLAEALSESEKPYHLFVISSTVSPGTIEKNLIPLIERVSGRVSKEGFGVCYNPEFIALGDVIHGMLQPDFVLVGEGDTYCGEILQEIYERACENNPPVARMSIISAEIAKISLNAFITTKISFANTLAQLCDRIPGANVDHITQALGNDRRVSPHYLKGGLPFGGSCFPRDNRAFQVFAKDHGVEAHLAQATDHVNNDHIQYILDKIVDTLKRTGGESVSILGVAFKTNTPVIDESPSIKLIQRLLEEYKAVSITVFDHHAHKNVVSLFDGKIRFANTIPECVRASAVSIIMTAHDEFKDVALYTDVGKKHCIIDCWRIVDPNSLHESIEYIPFGVTSY